MARKQTETELELEDKNAPVEEAAHLEGEWSTDIELEADRPHIKKPGEIDEPSEDEIEELELEADQDNEDFYNGPFKLIWALPANVDPAFERLAITDEKEPYARPASDAMNAALNYLFPDIKGKKSFLWKMALIGQFGLIQAGAYKEALAEIRSRQVPQEDKNAGSDSGGKTGPNPVENSPLAFMDAEGRA